MPARNFLFLKFSGDLALEFGELFASVFLLEAFLAVWRFLGAFWAMGAALIKGRLSGTKLCLLTGGAVDLRAVGCLAFLGLGWLDMELEDFFLFLDSLGWLAVFKAGVLWLEFLELDFPLAVELESDVFFLDFDGRSAGSSASDPELASLDADLGSLERSGGTLDC